MLVLVLVRTAHIPHSRAISQAAALTMASSPADCMKSRSDTVTAFTAQSLQKGSKRFISMVCMCHFTRGGVCRMGTLNPAPHTVSAPAAASSVPVQARGPAARKGHTARHQNTRP